MLSRAFRLLMVTGFGVGGSLANFLAQTVIAYRFGTGQDVDSYVFSLGLPTFVAGLIAICISYVVVPELAKIADDPEREHALSSRLLTVVVRLAGILAVCAIPALLIQPLLLLPRMSPIHAQPGLEILILIAWLTGAVQLVNALLIARLNAVGRPIAAAMLSIPPGLVSVAVLLAMPIRHIWVAALGVFLGTVCVTAIGFASQLGRFAWQWRPPLEAPPLPIRRSVWLSVIALTCFSSYAVIDSFWAPRVGEGTLSALGYAQRILIGAGNLIIVGPSAIAVPFLARIVATGDVGRFRRGAAMIVLSVGAGAAIVAMLIGSFADPIVSLLFQRGAFGAVAAHQVASALAHLAPGMAAMLAGVILMRAIFCIPDTFKWSAAIGLGWSAFYFVLSGIFADRTVTGLADAYSLSWILTVVAASIVLWQRSATIGITGTA